MSKNSLNNVQKYFTNVIKICVVFFNSELELLSSKIQPKSTEINRNQAKQAIKKKKKKKKTKKIKNTKKIKITRTRKKKRKKEKGSEMSEPLSARARD